MITKNIWQLMRELLMNEGFFDFEKAQAEIKELSSIRSDTLKKSVCEKCKLCKNQIPKMDAIGKGKKKILIVTNNPECIDGQIEKEKLRNILKAENIDLNKDCWYVYAVKCYTDTVSIARVKHCKQFLIDQIEELKPHKILILGKASMQALYCDEITISDMGRYYQAEIPCQKYKAFVYPFYSIEYMDYQKNTILWDRFKKTIHRLAVRKIEDFKDYGDLKKDYNHLLSTDIAKIKKFLAKIIPNQDPLFFDYETTGLKPHAPGHEIICVSMQQGKNALSFPMYDEVKPIIAEILLDKKIKKVAHNMAFEDDWSYFILNTNVNGWFWDTQLTAHVMDNRQYFTSLKHQVFLNCGVLGYDKEVSAYIKSTNGTANGFNRMKELDIEKVLLYCFFDTMFMADLYPYQKAIIKKDKHLAKGNKFLLRSMRGLNWVQKAGICVDMVQILKNEESLNKRLFSINESIQKCKEVKKLNLPPGQKFDHTSNDKLKDLLYCVLGYETENATTGGAKSVEKEALEKINSELCKLVLEYRRLFKALSYVLQLKREAVEIEGLWKIFPMYRLSGVVTYRGSASNPSWQNIPVRDPEIKKLIRGCIIPSPNNQIAEADYSAVEVAASACYNEDPKLIEYVTDPTKDMHRDVASLVFGCKPEEVSKPMRQMVKGGFVFSQFYGDWWKQCAEKMWIEMTSEFKKTLKVNTGISTLGKLKYNDRGYIDKATGFYNHIQEIEYDFWYKRFKIYNQWKKDNWTAYQKNGYVELKTGFRMTTIQKRTKVNNGCIQGSAFHILLWSLYEIVKYLKKGNYKTCIIGQIHDSLIFDFAPGEREELLPAIKYIMEKKIKKHWKWIIIPLRVEFEITPVNGSWDQKKEITE